MIYTPSYKDPMQQLEGRSRLMEARSEEHELLKLIVAEWKSDPMSVQCFDLRIVERAKAAVANVEKLERHYG